MSELFEVVELGGVKTVKAKSACNHVYVVDVSGSMYGSLPTMRQHLKNIISLVAQPEDTFSVIYFSGKGQAGVVFENLLVSDASTVSAMHSAIDRYIKPIGLTGFTDPLKLAVELNLNKSNVNNFIMLTDGYDNQSRRADIIDQTQKLKDVYQSISFIEYGYYADRDLIGEMAKSVDGLHIFAEGVTSYESVFEDAVRGVSRVNNIEVKVNKRAKHALFEQNGQVRIVAVQEGLVSVPEDTARVYSVVPSDVISKQLSEDHLFMVLFYAAKTVNSDLVWKALQALGDVALVEQYTNAFTKQELSKFEESVQKAVLDKSARFVDGKDLNAVPDKNAPTIVDLLQVLSGIDAQIVVDSPDWSYNRTSRASKTEEVLPKFVPSPMSHVALKNLVFNSSRPNISIQTNLRGQVKVPENTFGISVVPSHITRNYTIIKDGIRNMDVLPVLFGKEHVAELEKFAHEVIEEGEAKVYWNFKLDKTPVINRGQTEKVRLSDYVDTVAELEVLKASLKVIKFFIDEQGGSTAKIAGLVDKYGEEGAKWLSSIGVRDYGFSPVGTTSVESTDEYESVQVEYKIKGASNLPAINAVQKKVAENKKLNFADQLINTAIGIFGGFGTARLEVLKTDFTEKKRELEATLAGIVYALVLGRQWYGEEEDVVVDLTINGEVAPMTISKVRKMIKI